MSIASLQLSFFFFSSRRRHTRSLCDWSSDVCSSDLEPALVADSGAMAALTRDTAGTELAADVDGERLIGLASPIRSAGGDAFGGFVAFRSHERELGAFRALQHTIGFSLALGLLLALASAYVLARQIAGPIRRLALATRRVQDG